MTFYKLRGLISVSGGYSYTLNSDNWRRHCNYQLCSLHWLAILEIWEDALVDAELCSVGLCNMIQSWLSDLRLSDDHLWLENKSIWATNRLTRFDKTSLLKSLEHIMLANKNIQTSINITLVVTFFSETTLRNFEIGVYAI